MNADWYKGVNPGLEKLAGFLGMGGGKKPSHGYTIAERAPEVVTAPGVYFPAEKGEVIPLEGRAKGGDVSPSKSKDPETRKLDILESIIAMIKPSGMENRLSGGIVSPPEPLKLEQSKLDILKSSINILKPPPQNKESGEKKPSSEGSIALEPRQGGGNVDPSLDSSIMEKLKSILQPGFKENTRSTAFRSDQLASYNQKYGIKSEPDLYERLKSASGSFDMTPSTPSTSALPTVPSPPTGMANLPTTGSYSMKPDSLKEPDLYERLKAASGSWNMTPFQSRADGGSVEPPMIDESEEEKLRRIAAIGPPLTPTQVELGERLKWGAPGYRENVLAQAQATNPNVIKVAPGYERSYYEAHPEEALMDEVTAANKPAMDMAQRLVEEARTRAQGYGVGFNKGRFEKGPGAQERMLEAAKSLPELGMNVNKIAAATAEEKQRVLGDLTKGEEKSVTPHLVQDANGQYVWATPGGILPAGIMGKQPESADAPTELKLIAKSREVGPDGKPTPAAIEAKGQLEDSQKRKIELAEAQLDVKSKDINTQAIADAISEGQDARIAVKGSMGNPVASKAQSLVLSKYPKFNFNMSDANYKWKQSQTNQRTINFVGGALPRVEALANQLQALKNTDIPAINALMRQVSIQTGKPEYTTFEANRNAIVQEINTALSGSATGSDMRIKIELENLGSARSPQQIIGAVNNLREALIARLDVDLSDIYPLEVVQGKKTLEGYKEELFKKYRGKYGKPPEYETQTKEGASSTNAPKTWEELKKNRGW